MHELRGAGVGLFLHQQGLDTTTPAGKAMFGMLAVFGELEAARDPADDQLPAADRACAAKRAPLAGTTAPCLTRAGPSRLQLSTPPGDQRPRGGWLFWPQGLEAEAAVEAREPSPNGREAQPKPLKLPLSCEKLCCRITNIMGKGTCTRGQRAAMAARARGAENVLPGRRTAAQMARLPRCRCCGHAGDRRVLARVR